MRSSSTHRIITLVTFLVALARAASLDSSKDGEAIRERFRRPRGRHLRRSPPVNRRHRQGRRRAETDAAVHEMAPKVDEYVAVEPKPIEVQDFCSDPVARFDVSAALAELEVNQFKFNGLQNYDMSVQRECFCTEEWRDPYRLNVRNGNITLVINERTGEAVNPQDFNLPTVEDLFQQIETACTEPYADLNVVYDIDMGYPASSWFDMNECIADEEVGFTVTDLVDMTPDLLNPNPDGGDLTKGKKGNAPGQQDKSSSKPGKTTKPKDLKRRESKI